LFPRPYHAAIREDAVTGRVVWVEPQGLLEVDLGGGIPFQLAVRQTPQQIKPGKYAGVRLLAQAGGQPDLRLAPVLLLEVTKRGGITRPEVVGLQAQSIVEALEGVRRLVGQLL